MRQCGTHLLQPGMVLARPLFDKGFRMLLAEGVVLTPSYIKKIKSYNFPYIFIDEPGTENIVADDFINVKSRKEVYDVFSTYSTDGEYLSKSSVSPGRRRTQSAPVRNQTFKNIRSGKIHMLKKAADRFINGIMLSTAKTYYPSVSIATDVEFNHAVDVASLSVLIGLKFFYPQDEINRLAQAAFLHDIGKQAVIAEFAEQHPSDWTAEQLIEYYTHPEVGVSIVENDSQVDPRVSLAILQHHEHQDGSGFPEGIQGSYEEPTMKRKSPGKIFRLAEIIGLADYYDNLIKGRVEKRFFTPVEAVGEIIKHTPKWFNPHVTSAAVSIISVFPIGSNVLVEECRVPDLIKNRGVVSGINPDKLDRPKVLLLQDRHHKRLSKPIHIDFSQDSTSKLSYCFDLNQ